MKNQYIFIRVIIIFFLLQFVLVSNAQFSYHSSDGKKIENGTILIPTDSIQNLIPINIFSIDIENFNIDDSNLSVDEIEEERKILDEYIKKTEARYKRIKKRVSRRNKRNKDSSKKLFGINKTIFTLHENKNNILSLNFDYKTTFRTSNSITPQALSGLNLVNNSLGDNNSGVLELGAKINNLRISLPTKFKYKTKEENGKYIITRYQRDRYLYFDFISRGLLTLDSLQTTMSEYVNTTQGAPLSLRLNFQQRITPEYLDQSITKRREPIIFFNVDFDGRLVPVTSTTKIEEAGGSFHIMPSFVAVFPSGEISSKEQEDNFIIQLTLNGAYLSQNLREAMTPDSKDNPFYGNWAFSTELRLGNYSEINPVRNWSLFAKYTLQESIGSQFTFGFSFAPQGNKKSAEN